MQARVSEVAGRRLRQQLEQSPALREVLHHPAALAARRTAARTARQLAPRVADRVIADLKGTEPLLASVRAERRGGRRSGTLQLAATLSAAAVVGGLLVGGGTAYAGPVGDQRAASAPVAVTPLGSLTDPQVYPRPQSMKSAGHPVSVPKSVGLVVTHNADSSAVFNVRQLLSDAGATDIGPSAGGPTAGSLMVYVGGPSEGAGGEVDRMLRELATTTGANSTDVDLSGLPSGGYVLASGQLPAPGGGTYGAVVLAGVDKAGTFYAAQSLRQLLSPIQPKQGQGEGAKGFPGITIRDWPSGAPLRGTAESFYGTPWRLDQRLDLMDFLGRTKQNYFLYAPGADPFRLSRWRDRYPADQADQLRQLADRARQNHVTLAYAIDPSESFCFSSGEDVDALVAKLDSLRQLGFQAFQLQFLGVSYNEWHCDDDHDKYGDGPVAAAKAQAALVAKVQERLIAKHPELAPLSVMPTEYQKQGATPYRSTLASALPQGVQVVWSGGSAMADKVTSSQISDTAGLFGRPLITLDNYPANDSTPERLFLGGYTGRDPDVAQRSAVLLTSAMNQPYVSRIPLATAADFAWKPNGYQPVNSWQAALRSLAGGDPTRLAAFTALAGNSSSSRLDRQESAYLTPLIDQFWSALQPTGGGAPDPVQLRTAAQPLRDAFGTMAGASQALAEDPIAAEAGPWLERLSAYGRTGQAAVDMLIAQHGGDGNAAWQARVQLRQARDLLGQSPVTVGAGVLDPFLDKALKSADTWAGVTASGIWATTTLGTANDHVPALMTSDSSDSFYWSSASPQPGDYVALGLPDARPIGTVTVRMGSGGSGPDAASAANDYMHDAVLEYNDGSGTWRQLAQVHDQKTVVVTAPAGTVARVLRLRATKAQLGAVAVREFSFTAPGKSAPTVSGPPALPGSSPSAVLDGNPDTAFRAAAAPKPGDVPLTVELGATRPLDRVTVLTDPTVQATATAQVRRADGSWAPIGTVKPGYNELPAGEQPADAIRLIWAPGGEAPVVNQIIPWYGDVPAAKLSLADANLYVITGQAAAPAQTQALLEAARPVDTTGQLKVELPANVPGLTAAAAASVTVPRGSKVGAPLQLTAAPSTPTGTYQVPISFTAGTVTLRQVLQVHVVPPTGGPDLALTATASSSGDQSPDTPASAVADGDPKTRWASPAVDNAWVQLKLAKPVRLGQAVLHWYDDYASAYQLQASTDGVTWTTVAKVDSGAGGTETVRFDAPNAQYLRMQGTTRATKNGYSLWGIELYAVTP